MMALQNAYPSRKSEAVKSVTFSSPCSINSVSAAADGGGQPAWCHGLEGTGTPIRVRLKDLPP
jgi:hypothetical protein